MAMPIVVRVPTIFSSKLPQGIARGRSSGHMNETALALRTRANAA
jgi:hypothetical protein